MHARGQGLGRSLQGGAATLSREPLDTSASCCPKTAGHGQKARGRELNPPGHGLRGEVMSRRSLGLKRTSRDRFRGEPWARDMLQDHRCATDLWASAAGMTRRKSRVVMSLSANSSANPLTRDAASAVDRRSEPSAQYRHCYRHKVLSIIDLTHCFYA